MNIFTATANRLYQSIIYLAAHTMDFREPELHSGKDALLQLPLILKKKGFSRVLIVTDQGLFKLGIHTQIADILNREAIETTVFGDTVPNPTIDNIENALKQYNDFKAQAIIGLGGGSAIDCAKGVAARVTNPKRSIQKMKGLLKVKKRKAFLIAIPTTAGTGSEATVAVVVTNPKTHEKYAVNDPKLIPKVAVLAPELLVSLPGKITATTGMDALTHAVEAYTNHFQTKKTRAMARSAVKTIFESLLASYNDPTNIELRSKMQRAAYEAGLAFTRGYVGNVHAIAHTFGGFYQVPHGLANAIILPHALTYYGKKAYRRLSELADLVGIEGATRKEKAEAFIAAIRGLNQQLSIPVHFDKIVKDDDLPLMINRAYAEANPLYPVPMMLTKKQFGELYNIIQDK